MGIVEKSRILLSDKSGEDHIVVDPSIRYDPIWQNDKQRPTAAFYAAKYIGFAFLALSLLGSLYEEALEPWCLAHAVRWIWFALAILVAITANKISRKHNDLFLQIKVNKHG